MDIASKNASRLLEALAESKGTLTDFARQLRSQPEVVRVLTNFEPREYQTGFVLEGYVDAELRNGKAMAWWLEARWNESLWTIESRVLVNDDQGQYTFREFPERTAETLDDCIAQLALATTELIDSGDAVALVTRK
jgi:hypothetical protein